MYTYSCFMLLVRCKYGLHVSTLEPCSSLSRPQAHSRASCMRGLKHHPCSSRLSQSAGLSSLCHRAASHQPSILYTAVYVRQSYSPSSSHLLPSHVHMTILYCCISIPPCKQAHLYHLSRFHTYSLCLLRRSVVYDSL